MGICRLQHTRQEPFPREVDISYFNRLALLKVLDCCANTATVTAVPGLTWRFLFFRQTSVRNVHVSHHPQFSFTVLPWFFGEPFNGTHIALVISSHRIKSGYMYYVCTSIQRRVRFHPVAQPPRCRSNDRRTARRRLGTHWQISEHAII